MHAKVIEEFQGIEGVHDSDIPVPQPNFGEIQIQLNYAGVNPVDWKICKGAIRSLLPHQFPITLGWDGAGVVSKIGEGVTEYAIGDEVYAYFRRSVIHQGTFCRYATFSAEHVVHKPKSLSLAEAAAVPLSALTAWQALIEFAGITQGDRILIQAGAGGVGSYAIQLARYKGCKIYTTASAENHDYVKDLGADVAIDYHRENLFEYLKREEPQGLDCILDMIGGPTLQRSYEAVRKGGALVSIVQPVDKGRAELMDIRGGFVFVRPDGAQLRAISDLFDSGDLVAPEIEEMPLDNVQEALRKSAEGHVRGKIVLKI